MNKRYRENHRVPAVNFKVVALLSVMAILLLNCPEGGCCKKKSPEPKREGLLEIFNRKTISLGNSGKSIEVYIDGSASMAGFASPEDTSTYARLLLSLYLRLNNATDDSQAIYCKFYEEDEPQRLDDKDLVMARRSRNFYTGSNTHLCDLIEGFHKREESSLPPAFLILTDAMQSRSESTAGTGKRYDVQALALAMARWLRRGFVIHVFKFDSYFNGTYYSETYPSGKFSYRDTRPFYLFVFSTNDTVLSKIKDIVRHAAGNPEEFALPADIYKKGWQGVISEGRDVKLEGLQPANRCDDKYPPIFFQKRKRGIESAIFSLSMRGLEERDIKWLRNRDLVSVSGRDAWGGNLNYSEDNISLETGRDEDRSQYVKVNLEFPPHRSDSKIWEVYRVYWIPESRELFPKWIIECSTNDDSALKKCKGKTLYLDNLLRRILIEAEIGIQEFFVVLKP